MKKLLLLLALSSCLRAVAQTAPSACPEPEFIGRTFVLLPGGGYAELDREVIRIHSHETAASLFGVGKRKTDLVLDESEVVVRLKAGDPIRFVVRVADNNFDPVATVNIFRFRQKGKRRKAETASVSTFGSYKQNDLERLRFTGTKYGNSSYLITLYERLAGEYGLLLDNPYCIQRNSLTVATFAIEE